jgi:predicted Zn-dependent protease
MTRTRSFLVFGLWSLVAVAGVGAITLITVEQEIEVGKRADQQVRKQLHELRDAETTAYVRDIGRRLAKVSGGPAYPYSFAVADYRELNAFALPGGPVWIHRGVLHAATSESQVASVLAHEIAHIARRHAASRLTSAMLTNMGLGLLGAMLGNSGGATAAQNAAGLMANGMFLKFSRDDERDADRAGLTMMMRAGWDGRGMVELFEILRREQKRDPLSVETFFSSHPSPGDRIEGLRAATAQAARGRRDSQQFQLIKARLLKMPPPRALPRP